MKKTVTGVSCPQHRSSLDLLDERCRELAGASLAVDGELQLRHRPMAKRQREQLVAGVAADRGRRTREVAAERPVDRLLEIEVVVAQLLLHVVVIAGCTPQ